MQEIEGFFGVHRAEGTIAGGIHLEITSSAVRNATSSACSALRRGSQ
jgi:3-deoxy-7-phosphoheptulonate synthase